MLANSNIETKKQIRSLVNSERCIFVAYGATAKAVALFFIPANAHRHKSIDFPRGYTQKRNEYVNFLRIAKVLLTNRKALCYHIYCINIF